MKRIVIFVALKIAEISAFLFIPYWLGRLGDIWFKPLTMIQYWGRGTFFLCVAFMAVVVFAAIVVLIIANWELANNLKQKFWGQK